MQNKRNSPGRRVLDFFLGERDTRVTLTEVVEGIPVIYLNNMMVDGKFQIQAVSHLMELYHHNGSWAVGSDALSYFQGDAKDRLPNLICDLGGLTEFEIRLYLSGQDANPSYTVAYRRKGTNLPLKYTEVFTYINTPLQEPTMQTQQPKTFAVILNQFMSPMGIDLNLLKDHLVKSEFFIDEMDCRSAVTAMVPSMPVLAQLTEQFIVTANIWEKKQPNHPGWNFICVDRHVADLGFQPFAQADMGMSSNHSPNRGAMFGRDCFGRPLNAKPVTNLELVQVLGAYALTQIHPLPPAQFGAYPAGLELLDMVKSRLFQGQQNMVQPFSMPPMNPYGGAQFGAFPFGPFMGAATNTARRMTPLPTVTFEFTMCDAFSETVAGIQEILLRSEELRDAGMDEIELLIMLGEISRELQMADIDGSQFSTLFLTIGEHKDLLPMMGARLGLGFNGWVVHSATDADGTVGRPVPEVVIFRRQVASW